MLLTIWDYFRKSNASVTATLIQILAQCLLLARRGGYRGLRAHLKRQMRSLAQFPHDYALWAAAHTPDPTRLEEMAATSTSMAHRPVVSIILPGYENREKLLMSSIQSVLGQAYPFWELCLVTEEGLDHGARNLLEAHAINDRRITIMPRTLGSRLSEGLCHALFSATGDFICSMEPGDEISPDALFELGLSINAHPDADMFYSDEDSIDGEGNRSRPFFKPDWSPEYLDSFFYTGSLSCYRTSLSSAIGGFRQGFEGAEQYDFALRFVEKAQNIVHLPKVLYHRRSLPDSTETVRTATHPAGNSAVKALTERLERLHAAGTVREAFTGCFDVRRKVNGNPLVSIIIPSAGKMSHVRGRDIDLLVNCVQSVATRSTYSHYEILIVDNGDLKAGTVQSLAGADCRFVQFREKVPNVAEKMNLGALHARGDHLLFLNDDIEVVSPDWLEAMLQFCQRAEIGAVGAKLYYEDGSLQHVGVTLNDDGLPDHQCRGSAGSSPGYYFSSVASRTCLAVTGACLMTRKEVFEEVGGFEEKLAMSYNDIDYCLKVHSSGYRTVFTPHAELFHYESVTRSKVVDFSESDLFLQRWHAKIPADPYYSPHLDPYPPNFSVRVHRR